MRTFWITIGNTPASILRSGLNELNYPLAYNTPATAISFTAPNIQVLRNPVDVLVDLCIEIKREIIPSSRFDAKEAIAGYRLCIGVGEKIFLDPLKAPPNKRDLAVAEYYSRWPNGHNLLSDIWQSSWEELIGAEINLFLGNDKSSGQIEMLHSPMKVVSFLSEFTTLKEGDVISLGCVCVIYDFVVENDSVPLEASIIDKRRAIETSILKPVA